MMYGQMLTCWEKREHLAAPPSPFSKNAEMISPFGSLVRLKRKRNRDNMTERDINYLKSIHPTFPGRRIQAEF